MDKREADLFVRVATAMERTNHDVGETLALFQAFVYEMRADQKAVLMQLTKIAERLNVRDEITGAFKLPQKEPDKHTTWLAMVLSLPLVKFVIVALVLVAAFVAAAYVGKVAWK